MKTTGHLAVLALGGAGLFVAAAQVATLVRQPYLQNLRGDRATIIWTTRQSGSAFVQYSTDRSFSRQAEARSREFTVAETGLSSPYFHHQAELTGLSGDAEYFYRVVVSGQSLTTGDSFRTDGPGPFTFLALGDSGLGTPEQSQVAQRMNGERPALVLHTGDVVYPSGTFAQFEASYFAYYQDLMKRTPFFPALGNHCYETNNAAPYLAVHAMPTDNVPLLDRGRYYSFDWGNAHFISLDTNTPLVSAVSGTGQMLEWLENDLRRTRKFWRIVYYHHAPYASGPHENDSTAAAVRARVVPILERYGVQLALNGHEHSYQRSFPLRAGRVVAPGAGIVYITTGGGGARLYPVFPRDYLEQAESFHHYLRGEVQGSRLIVRAIRADGVEFDNLTLAPQPVITSESMVNSASFMPALAPGALVSIFGSNLAALESQATRLPLPTELSGVAVTLNGRRLPLLYVSSSQINAQVPFDVQGPATLRVITPNAQQGSMDATVTIADAAPGLFSPFTVVHANGVPVTAASPAEPGEPVAIFLTGLGRVNGEIAAGQAAPLSPLLTARAPVVAQLGGINVAPSFAGLAPGFVGLYQVNIQVPVNLSSGAQTLRIMANGVPSNAHSILVYSPFIEPDLD